MIDWAEALATIEATRICKNLMQYTWQNFNNKQIVSVTGHKSSSSLEIYRKVNSDEKLAMGQSLAGSLVEDKIDTQRKHSYPSATVTSNENSENEEPQAKLPLLEIPDESDPNFNFSPDEILQIVQECEKASEEFVVSNANNSNNNQLTTQDQNTPKFPSFNNCRIGNITINIQK